jgi:hypothetical protein
MYARPDIGDTMRASAGTKSVCSKELFFNGKWGMGLDIEKCYEFNN